MFFEIIFYLSLFDKSNGQMFKKVKLKDVDVLTLHQGRMTAGRRSSPVPQLQCRGGTAGCGAFVPEVVQCYNRGSDGLDTQWECKADMDNEYRFGKVSVSCEGYDYPDDPYILAGSCGLEYTIDLTNGGKEQKSNSYTGYSHTGTSTNTDEETNWVFVLIVVFVVFMLFKNLTTNENEIPPAGTAPPPYNPDFIPPAGSDAPPPPTYSSRRSGWGGWRPGFFSGFGAGWFGNGMWNGNRGYRRHGTRYSNQHAYNQGFRDGNDSSWTSSTHKSSSPKSSSRSSSSSGTRTASGFGGTTRR